MMSNNDIEVRRVRYSCCALAYMAKASKASMYGDSHCEDPNYRLAIYMMWAAGVARRADTSTEIKGCLEDAFVEEVFRKADCYCDVCGCGNTEDSSVYPPLADPCAPTITYGALAAVDVADRVAIELAGPSEGDTYLVVNDTGGSGWTVNTLQEWNGSGWDATLIADGDVIEVGGGELWTTLNGVQPGLLYPTVTLTWVGGATDMYIIQSDYPQVAAFTGRTAIVELWTSGGWLNVFQGPEADLASPTPFDATGISFTDIRATYILGSCSWSSLNGSIEPPGCVFPGSHSCSSHDIEAHF